MPSSPTSSQYASGIIPELNIARTERKEGEASVSVTLQLIVSCIISMDGIIFQRTDPADPSVSFARVRLVNSSLPWSHPRHWRI